MSGDKTWTTGRVATMVIPPLVGLGVGGAGVAYLMNRSQADGTPVVDEPTLQAMQSPAMVSGLPTVPVGMMPTSAMGATVVSPQEAALIQQREMYRLARQQEVDAIKRQAQAQTSPTIYV